MSLSKKRTNREVSEDSTTQLKKSHRDASNTLLSNDDIEYISQTLYIQNLNDKINHNVLKHNLYLMFSTYGDIIEVVINSKNKKMRGQAHVILNNSLSAKLALKNLQSLIFFEKPLKISYSLKKSKIISRIEGSLDYQSDNETEDNDEIPHYE